jgi:hypothetical protein
MAQGAKLIDVIYVDTQETQQVLIGIGDSIRAQDWAKAEYPYPDKPELGEALSGSEIEFNRELWRTERAQVEEEREWRAGLYAVYLGAVRGKLRGSEEGWLEWLSLVTIPDAEGEADDEESDAGEQSGPPSAV